MVGRMEEARPKLDLSAVNLADVALALESAARSNGSPIATSSPARPLRMVSRSAPTLSWRACPACCAGLACSSASVTDSCLITVLLRTEWRHSTRSSSRRSSHCRG
jgi:hypothetical protein